MMIIWQVIKNFDMAGKVDSRLWPFDCSELIKTNWFETCVLIHVNVVPIFGLEKKNKKKKKKHSISKRLLEKRFYSLFNLKLDLNEK